MLQHVLNLRRFYTSYISCNILNILIIFYNQDQMPMNKVSIEVRNHILVYTVDAVDWKRNAAREYKNIIQQFYIHVSLYSNLLRIKTWCLVFRRRTMLDFLPTICLVAGVALPNIFTGSTHTVGISLALVLVGMIGQLILVGKR